MSGQIRAAPQTAARPRSSPCRSQRHRSARLPRSAVEHVIGLPPRRPRPFRLHREDDVGLVSAGHGVVSGSPFDMKWDQTPPDDGGAIGGDHVRPCSARTEMSSISEGHVDVVVGIEVEAIHPELEVVRRGGPEDDDLIDIGSELGDPISTSGLLPWLQVRTLLLRGRA